MNEMMIQEAVLNSIDMIDGINGAQLVSEYSVLMGIADTYMKSALIQEANVGIAFDGERIVQESEAKDDDKTDTNKYDAGSDLTYADKGGPTVPPFVKTGVIKDQKWYNKIWEWIKKAARFIRGMLRKIGARLKGIWTNIRTLSDVEAQAYRKCGCKLTPGDGENKYVVAFPFNIDLDEASNSLDTLIGIFEKIAAYYQKAVGAEDSSNESNNRFIKDAQVRLNAIAAKFAKSVKGKKTYYTAHEFFDKQEDLVNRLAKIEKDVDDLKKMYSEKAIKNEYVAIATKAAGIFNIMNNAVTKSHAEALNIIDECKAAAKNASDKVGLKKDAKNLKKEQEAIARQNALED